MDSISKWDTGRGVWVITPRGDLVLTLRCTLKYSHDQRLSNEVVLHTPDKEQIPVQSSSAYSHWSSPMPEHNRELIAFRDAVVEEMASAIQEGRIADLRNIPVHSGT